MLRRIALLCLLVSASAWARDNGSGWIEVRSPHFTVVTDAGDRQGRHVLAQFERMRWVFQSSLPGANLDPANPILVIAVRNKKDMEALEPAVYLEKGQIDLGGLFSRSTDANFILVMWRGSIHGRSFITSTRIWRREARRSGCLFG
jgi:hypothetical protein